MKTLSKIVCTFASAFVAITPIAASANTRAGDSSSIYSAPLSSGSGLSGATTEEDDENNFFVVLLLGSWITGIAFIIFEDDNQSPGGN